MALKAAGPRRRSRLSMSPTRKLSVPSTPTSSDFNNESTQVYHFVEKEKDTTQEEKMRAPSERHEDSTTVASRNEPTLPTKTEKVQRVNAFERFLAPSDPLLMYPGHHFTIFLILGVLLSIFVIWVSEDEFFIGEGNQPSESITGYMRYAFPFLFSNTSKALDFSSNEGFAMDDDFKVHIAFHELGCRASGSSPLLWNVTGAIPQGELTAILGESGSGKTTFVQAILGRGNKRRCDIEGVVYMNGRPRSLEAFVDRVGFVPQSDVVFGRMTVHEVLSFSAEWRLPRWYSACQRSAVVDDALAALNLTHVRDSLIGTDANSILSGGERRRVSIGMELVAKPSVLVLDEPTSGLDGSQAYQLIKILRNITDTQSVTVLAVVHQPSARVYSLFENLMLMSRGQLVYSGKQNHVLTYLQQQGYRFAGDDADLQQRSPAEFIADVLSGEEAPSTPRPRASLSDLPEIWRTREESTSDWKQIECDMERFRRYEDEAFLRARLRKAQQRDVASANSVFGTSLGSLSISGMILRATGFDKKCLDPEMGSSPMCVAFMGTPFPVVPKPGLFRQGISWLKLKILITYRTGLGMHLWVTFCLAFTVSFVASFNRVWSHRPASNFLLCIAISLLGCLGTIYDDDDAPIERAANAGMMLAAYDNAAVTHSVFLGWIISHFFALCYFTFLWTRTGTWCCSPFSFGKYYEFTHIVHFTYLASSSIASVLLGLMGHEKSNTFIMSVGVLVHFHVFSLYSPNHNEANQTYFFNKRINGSPLVKFYATTSYVRYVLNVLLLWEPDRSDPVARTFVLRTYGYAERSYNPALVKLTAFWVICLSFKFILFSFAQATTYHASFGFVLHILFASKMIFGYMLMLIILATGYSAYHSIEHLQGRS